jgi:hypothetical protein
VFRAELQAKLQSIFGLRKTTFDAPSVNSTNGSFEQDTLFIEVNECNSRVTEGRAYAKVIGSLVVFSQMDKMPFGYFNKKIQQASHADTKDLFFFDIDLNPASSPARLQNITERRVRFVYLYSAQYDPAHGSITSLEGI